VIFIKKNIIKFFYLSFLVAIVILSGTIKVPINYTDYSSFEGDQTLPDPIEKTIYLNGILVLILILIAVLLFVFLFDNTKYIIFSLFLFAPLFRQINSLNFFFSKLLSTLLLVIFFLKGKYYKLVFQKVPKHFLIGAGIILIGMFISTTINSVSYFPFIRQLVFFLLIFSIHTYLNIYKINIINKLVAISVIPVFFDLFFGLFMSNDLGTAFAQTTNIFNSQSAVGAFLFCSLPFFHAFLYKKYGNNVLKTSWIIELLFLFFAILTGSRGGFIGILIYSIFLRIKKLSIIKILLIGLVLSILAYILIQIPFFYKIFRIDNPLSQRDLLLIVGADVVQHNFLFGTGPGSFSDAALNYGIDNGVVDLMKGGIWGSSTHNIYLDMIIEAGILGLFGLFYIFNGIFNQTKDRDSNFPSRISSSLLIAYIIISFFGTKVIMGGSVSEGLLLWLSFLYIPTIKYDIIKIPQVSKI
jgi:O-antigen ligase